MVAMATEKTMTMITVTTIMGDACKSEHHYQIIVMDVGLPAPGSQLLFRQQYMRSENIVTTGSER
jgi:uncharacterized spore protein YtfJ